MQPARLLILIKYFNLTKSEFANKIGITPQALHNYLVKDRNVGFKFARKIKNVFSEINVDWLIDGKGEMLVNITKDVTNLISSNESSEEYIRKELKLKNELLKLKDEKILQLEAENQALKIRESAENNKTDNDNIINNNVVRKKRNK